MLYGSREFLDRQKTSNPEEVKDIAKVKRIDHRKTKEKEKRNPLLYL